MNMLYKLGDRVSCGLDYRTKLSINGIIVGWHRNEYIVLLDAEPVNETLRKAIVVPAEDISLINLR